MTWPEAADILHRWTAVTLCGIAFFRFAFQVAIWPNLLLLVAGTLVATTNRRRFILWWVIGTALLMAGMFGFGAALNSSDWSDAVRSEPFGQVLLGLYILLGAISLVRFKKLQV